MSPLSSGQWTANGKSVSGTWKRTSLKINHHNQEPNKEPKCAYRFLHQKSVWSWRDWNSQPKFKDILIIMNMIVINKKAAQLVRCSTKLREKRKWNYFVAFIETFWPLTIRYILCSLSRLSCKIRFKCHYNNECLCGKNIHMLIWIVCCCRHKRQDQIRLRAEETKKIAWRI